MSNSRKSSSSRGGRGSNAIRVAIAIALLLLIVALMPFIVMKHAEFEAHGFHPLNQQLDNQQQSSSSVSSQKQTAGGEEGGTSMIKQVECQKYLNDATIPDPNREYNKDEMKRLTITEPKFYISLHNQFL